MVPKHVHVDAEPEQSDHCKLPNMFTWALKLKILTIALCLNVLSRTLHLAKTCFHEHCTLPKHVDVDVECVCLFFTFLSTVHATANPNTTTQLNLQAATSHINLLEPDMHAELVSALDHQRFLVLWGWHQTKQLYAQLHELALEAFPLCHDGRQGNASEVYVYDVP